MRPSSPFPQSVAGAPSDESEPFDESEERLQYNRPRGHPNGMGAMVGTARDERLTQLCARSYGTDQFVATVVAAQLDLANLLRAANERKGRRTDPRRWQKMLDTRNLVHDPFTVPASPTRPFDVSEERLRYNRPQGTAISVGRKVGTARDKRLTQLCARSHGTGQFDATVLAAQLDLLWQHKKIRHGKTARRPTGRPMKRKDFNALLKSRNLVHPPLE